MPKILFFLPPKVNYLMSTSHLSMENHRQDHEKGKSVWVWMAWKWGNYKKNAVMCSGEASVVDSVCDCTEHLVDGNNKDAKYIIKFFQEYVEELDSSHMYTASFLWHSKCTKSRSNSLH